MVRPYEWDFWDCITAAAHRMLRSNNFGPSGSMNRTLSDHISQLKQQIEALGQHIMDNNLSRTQRNRIESEIRAAQTALDHYRSAIALEKQLDSRATSAPK